MNPDIWHIFAAFGIPGLTLGVFYALYRRMNWTFARVPATWSGPLALVFIFVIALVILFALDRFSPQPKTIPPEQCGPEGCVDITRRADFSKSHCLKDGKKQDIAIFDDTFVLTNKSSTYYLARARPNAKNKQQVELYDLNVSATEPVQPYEVSCNNCDYPEMKWSLRTVNGVARGRWRWVDAHVGNDEGLVFDSTYTIRNIRAEYVLAKGVELSNKRFSSAGNADIKKCQATLNECLGIFSEKAVYFHWHWNQWAGC